MKRKTFMLLMLFLITAFSYNTARAQFTNLVNFTGSPSCSYAQKGMETDGTYLYGYAQGGTYDHVVAFRVKLSDNSLSLVNDFSGTAYEINYLLSGSNMYGVSYNGLTGGSIYSMDKTSGITTDLHILANDGSEGYNSVDRLVSDGTYLYGTNPRGGTGTNPAGNVFKVELSTGTYSILKQFTWDVAEGALPYGG